MGQVVGIDSSLFMYVWNRHPEFLEAAKKILTEVQDGREWGVLAEIGIIELLTGPKKHGRYAEAKEYKEKILNFPNLFIKNLNNNIVELASDLRAKYNLRTPDAIHIATAIDAGATVFYTNDKALKKVKEIKIQTL